MVRAGYTGRTYAPLPLRLPVQLAGDGGIRILWATEAAVAARAIHHNAAAATAAAQTPENRA